MSLRCKCSVVSGCWLTKHTERSDGSVFVRLWLRGPQAKAVLVQLIDTEARRFAQKYTTLADSGTVWPTLHGWCGILAGRVCKKPRRTQAAWSPTDVDRLRAAYHAAGIPGAQAEFPERSYDALTGALKRYKIYAERRRAEVVAL